MPKVPSNGKVAFALSAAKDSLQIATRRLTADEQAEVAEMLAEYATDYAAVIREEAGTARSVQP